MNQTMPVFSKTGFGNKQTAGAQTADTESVAGLTIRNNTGLPATPYLEQIRNN